MITLENWFVVYDGIGYTANGIVYGHSSPYCPDGEEIHTSLIESAETADEELILYTLNSEYHVRYDEMDCECYDLWRSLRIFERFAHKFGIDGCLDRVRERFAKLEKQQLELREEISSRMGSNSLYLDLSDNCEFYFRMGMFKSAGGTCEFIPRISDFDTGKGKLVGSLDYCG